MPDPITDFFTRLAAGDGGPQLADLTATVRFDVADADAVRHWRMAIDRGAVAISDSDADADAVLAIERPVLEELLAGRHNAMAAVLRGQLSVTGDADLLVRVERLIPLSDAPAHRDPAEQPAGRTAQVNLATAGGAR